LAVKTASEMTYTVSVGALSSTQSNPIVEHSTSSFTLNELQKSLADRTVLLSHWLSGSGIQLAVSQWQLHFLCPETCC